MESLNQSTGDVVSFNGNFFVTLYRIGSSLISECQMFNFFILTVCLIRIVSMGLAVLFKNISRKNPPSTTELAELLTKWKKHYLLICDLVLDLNEFIGIPLLIFLTKAFICFVGYSFYILGLLACTKRDLLFIISVLNLILKYLICVVILAFASEKISSEVR